MFWLCDWPVGAFVWLQAAGEQRSDLTLNYVIIGILLVIVVVLGVVVVRRRLRERDDDWDG